MKHATWNDRRVFNYARSMVLCLFAATTLLARSPNVVMLLSDDLGWKDIGCYGGPVKTPTLDKLASEGMRFTDFYSGAAVCSPSRAVLLTGRTNLRSGIYSWINDHDQRMHLPESEVTLAEILKENGFATAHFGKWHLGMPSGRQPDKPVPSDHGFDYWFATANNAQPSHHNPRNFVRNGNNCGQIDGYACDIVVNDAIDWLDKRPDQEQPFFLNVWIHEPHAPLAAPPDLVGQYGEQNDPAAIYSATIANTDQALKRLISKLHSVNKPDNTIIIYSSDNGSYRSDRVGHLRGTKGSNFEGGIRVPGIFHWPAHITAGAVTGEPGGLVDIVPTVCGLVGIDKPNGHLDGVDLSPLLLNNAAVERSQPLFWGLPLSGPAIAIRDGRYNMVAYRDGEVQKDNEGIAAIKKEIEALLRRKGIFESETRDSTFAKQLFEGFKDRDAEKLRGNFIRLNQFHESWIPSIKQSKFKRFELYDLVSDPSQTQDLSLREALVHARMKAKLLSIASDVFAEAHDWTTGDPPKTHVHRLKSTFRSPFDAFLYINRIPSDVETDETPIDLSGRILSRLANQEGRVQIKLPPGMNRLSYEGFKIAVGSKNVTNEGRDQDCMSCHRLPHLGHSAKRNVPSLRNRQLSKSELQDLLRNETHNDLEIDDDIVDRLHAFLQTLSDVSDADFRNLILKATVLDTSGDIQ